ncbi:hypothetical protein ACP275_07G055400 [Erythranthe tilingii]
MEGIREIARSYYSRASEEEKKSVQEFFEKLDVDRDGKVSRPELKRSATVSASLSADNIFQKLDVNGDGVLDFDEAKCLYYMANKVKIPRCCGCYDLLVGPYFSCSLCAGKSPHTYDLCCACYRAEGHESAHEHEFEHMVDNHTLMTELIEDRRNNAATPAPPAAAETSIIVEGENMKNEMDELRETAKAHYRAGSPEVQQLAYDFFKSMDTDEDGRVDLSEFLAFMRAQEGFYSNMRNRYFFNELDQDSNGTLDFSEVMSLYYIIKSRRPFCDFCGQFIPGIFFSCVECFNDSSGAPFDLCPVCYKAKSCKHEHDGRVQFLDNYTLLETKRDSDLALATSLNTNQQLWPSTSTSNPMVPVLHHSLSCPTYFAAPLVDHPPNLVPNNAIVPATSSNNKWGKWKVALTALEVALHVGSLSGACTIL